MVITFLPGSVYLFIYMCWFGATSASIDIWHDFSFRRENVKADSNLSYFSSRSPSELNCCECRLGDIEICVALVHLTSSELRSYLKNRVKTPWSERRFTFFLCIQLLSAIKVSALTWHMWFHMMGGAFMVTHIVYCYCLFIMKVNRAETVFFKQHILVFLIQCNVLLVSRGFINPKSLTLSPWCMKIMRLMMGWSCGEEWSQCPQTDVRRERSDGGACAWV